MAVQIKGYSLLHYAVMCFFMLISVVGKPFTSFFKLQVKMELPPKCW